MAALVGASAVGETAVAAVPVVTTNTLPVTGSDVVGSQVTFIATFSNAATYQWRKDTGGGAVNIPGATNTILTLSNLQLSDTASPGYSLQASNASGVASSSARPFTVNPVPSAVSNIITLTANQTGTGTKTNFTPTWTVATGSLIAGLSPSSVGGGNFSLEGGGGVAVLTDGTFGSITNGTAPNNHPSFATCGSSGGNSITYALPASAAGYDITNIVVYGGWNDSGRDQQGYTVYYSTLANPNTFIQLTTVNYNPSIPGSVQSATRVTLSSSTNAALAKNVAKVKFDFTAVTVENGYTGYSEIGLFGLLSANLPVANVPTSSPGPPIYAGTLVTLNEAASGVPPLQYQWQWDNGTGGITYSNIPGATGSNYLLNTTLLGGTTNNYRVTVTDTNGSSTSAPLPLTIIDISGKPVVNPPTALPGSSVYLGTPVTLNEAALGAQPLQYQWQWDNGTGGITYSNIPGATGSNYVVDTTSFGNAAINYRVVVTNVQGSSVSPPIVLTITDTTQPPATVQNLRCEHMQDPLGIDVTKPRLSWINTLTQRGAHQTACQVLVASSPAILAQNQGDLWNSGKIPSDQSVLVEYAGQLLTSAEACYWKVRTWDQNGNASAWSPMAMWSMGLLKPSDWSAKWIGMVTDTSISPAPPSPMLRKTFAVSEPVARATAYICGLGYFELQLNGEKVGDHVLDPTWTRYDLQADYITFDVTTNLIQGQNAIGVQLANAFYNQWSSDAWNTYTAPWRALPQMIIQLDIQYTDGTSNRVISDQTWKASTGPLVLDATRLGEVYDARLEKPGWSTAGYDDSAWTNAILRGGVAGSLIAPDAEPIKVFQTVNPISIIPVSGQPGVYTFDFGQNLVGWGRLSVSGPAGTSVTMIYSEKTNSDGSVNQNNINYLVNLTSYFQKDTYILKGSGIETYEPRFTYHGFRYAQVQGLPATPTTNTLMARVVHTAFDPAGSFLCSNDLLNRIETNTLWSYLGNFVGIPTDCPTREKNGWTGDAQLAAEIGLTHFHSEAAYTRWIKEFRPAQMGNGQLSGVFPNAVWGYGEGPAWESAFLLVPWFVYQHCGDVRILTKNYVGMKAYVDYETSVAANNIVTYGLGDWEPAATTTPASVTDTAYYYQGALIVAQTAALMGDTATSLQYSNLAAQIRMSFNNTFYNTNTSQYSGGTQTAQSCALYQNIVDSNQVNAVANILATSVQNNGNCIDTGILGSKYLLRALCDNGHSDTAMALAMQTAYPSWGHQVTNGATTLWETWSGAGSQDSLNHVMFGDVSAWFIEYLAGIRPGSPGYKMVIIKPEITGALAWAQANHDSPYGMISSAWQINGQSVSLNITIPPGSTALVYLPTLGTTMTSLVVQETGATIWAHGAAASSVPGVVFDHFEGAAAQTYAVWAVASGSYQCSWSVFPVPNGLAARSANGWVGLSWNPLPGVTGYNVKRSFTSGGLYTLLSNGVLDTNYVDSAVTNGVASYYVISAAYTNGESLNSSEVSALPLAVPNFGFEMPRVGAYQYNPSGGSWTFSGTSGNGSGILANGSAFSNPNAPQGTQAGFVQSYGTISQTLYGFSPGTNYTITYSAAQRSGANQHGGESWNVMIDNTVIKTNNPGGTSYTSYNATFTASAPNHTLAFAGTDLATGDNTVFIDNVQITPLIQSVPATVTLTSPANNTIFTPPATLNLAATVTTNGNTINSVQFYSGPAAMIAQDTTPPYSYAWTNVSAGSYLVRARVVFNGGNIADSAVANIVVSPPMIQSFGLVSSDFFLSGATQSGQPIVLVTTPSLTPPVVWTPLITNQSDINGFFTFTNLLRTNQQQFYRVLIP